MMGYVMHKNIKTTLMILIVPALIAVFFFENIRGYYRFKELCGQEKRLVITTKLERDVGWQMDLNKPASSGEAFDIAGLPNIKFVRFQDWEDRKLHDAYYVGKTLRVADGGASRRDNWKEDYEVYPANLENQVIYQWGNFNENLPNETRMSRGGYRFTDLRNKQIVVSFTQLGYSTFDRNHTLLDAPSGNVCGEVGKIWEQEIQSQIFAN